MSELTCHIPPFYLLTSEGDFHAVGSCPRIRPGSWCCGSGSGGGLGVYLRSGVGCPTCLRLMSGASDTRHTENSRASLAVVNQSERSSVLIGPLGEQQLLLLVQALQEGRLLRDAALPQGLQLIPGLLLLLLGALLSAGASVTSDTAAGFWQTAALSRRFFKTGSKRRESPEMRSRLKGDGCCLHRKEEEEEEEERRMSCKETQRLPQQRRRGAGLQMFRLPGGGRPRQAASSCSPMEVRAASRSASIRSSFCSSFSSSASEARPRSADRTCGGAGPPGAGQSAECRHSSQQVVRT
ncbi:hypothetical protein EYF80_043983 [Liparis tanakae]|uniref:Uncharacterized protein n=1 Tax=Liparis tanakae TaxID=230148 RepID=A0A4Z2FY42_9TELE|nr:hypothetical protein EYF80_043983 [Liparis tanakae]